VSYKLSEKRLLPGGLNLLMPGDSPPQDESLDLTDWWPGAAGKLEQAPQPAQVSTAGVVIDSIMKTGAHTYTAGGGLLLLDGNGLDSGYATNYPVGMISFQMYTWFTSQAKQSRHDGSATPPAAWTVPGPTAAPTVTQTGDADHFYGFLMKDQVLTYYVTWVIVGLGETNPSPASVPITIAFDYSAVTITRPTPAPAGVTAWNIYREVGGIPYLANTTLTPLDISIATVGDAATDTTLLDFGQIMEADHDPAPPAAIMANQTFNGRIVVANSAAHPNRMWWTPANQPAFFRGSGDAYDGDWVDVGTDPGDAILAIIVRPGMLVIYRAKSIWRQIGDFDDANVLLEPACLDIGIAGVRAVASTAAADYFVGSGGEGVYSFNNDWPTKLSQKVEPLFRGLTTENFAPQDTTQSKLCAVGHHRGRLYVSYKPTVTGAQASFILHIESGRWFACSKVYRVFQDTGDSFLGASPAGASSTLYALESAYGNASTALAFQSQYQDCGMPDHEKTFADLVISANTRGHNLTVTVRTNKNATANDSFDLANLLNVAGGKQIIPLLYPVGHPKANLPVRAFNLSVRITGPGATAVEGPITIDSPILLHYYQEARRGNLFDTGNTNHGLEGVGMIDQIELDIDSSSGQAGLVISSDIPGGVMTDRTSIFSSDTPPVRFPIVVAKTTGRQVLRIQLSSPVYGRLFRHQIGTTTDFQLYGYKVRLLPIGIYLDGANPAGDFWYTGALSPGVGAQ
jgi:hypothetical protein